MRHTLLLPLLMVLFPASLNALTADTSCGIIWDEPILLSDTIHDAFSPKIALSGDDTIHITWWSAARFGTSDVRLPYCSSTDGGATIQGPTELLQDSIAFPGYAFTPQIVAQGNAVYAFFVGSTAGKTPVRMIYSGNAGADWDSVRNISQDSVGRIETASISNDTIALVFAPPPYYREILRSGDGGLSWTYTNESFNTFARVSLSPGVLHLVQRTAHEVEYRRSLDLGDSWAQVSALSTSDQFFAVDPTIAAGRNDSNIIVAWGDDKYGNFGLSGASIISRTGIVDPDSTRFQEEELLTTEPRGSRPSVAIRAGRRAVAWPSEVVPFTTWHASIRASSGLDTTWCNEVDLTPKTPYIVDLVEVALSTKAVHVVWSQNESPSPGTFRIFYRRGRFATTDVKDQPDAIPHNFMLSQNYPNPFNPTTRIGFRVSGLGYVVLKVFDMLGREVATLVNEKKDIGEHSVEWNAEGLPSGVYYYRLIAWNRIETRKAILIR